MFWKRQAARMVALEGRVTALEEEVAHLARRCGAVSLAERRQAARDRARDKRGSGLPDSKPDAGGRGNPN